MNLMNARPHRWITGVASFLAAMLLSWSATSQAFVRRVPATVCHGEANANATAYNAGIGNSHATSDLRLWCGVPSDTSLNAGSITTTNVKIYDGSNTKGVSVAACYMDLEFSGGGDCSVMDKSGNSYVGNDSLNPPTLWSGLSGWTNADYAYLMVDLPDDGNPSRSYIRGFYLAD